MMRNFLTLATGVGRRRRAAAIPVGLGLAAVTIAACGSSGPPRAATQPQSGPAAAAYAYARCIRAHGVPNFPDPHVTTSPGRVSISQQAVPESGAAASRFTSAEKACRGFLAAINGQAQAQQKADAGVFLAFARCLRGHGISGFPDPNRDGQITRQMLSASGVDLRSPAFLSAAKACIGVTHGVITPAEIHAAITGPH